MVPKFGALARLIAGFIGVCMYGMLRFSSTEVIQE